MANPPLQGRARIPTKSDQPTRGAKLFGPLVRPEHEGSGGIAGRARSGIAAYVDEHPELRSAAMAAANIAGAGAGVVRGGYHMAKGLVDAAEIVQRLTNPGQDFATGRTPVGLELAQLGIDAGRYVAKGVANPKGVADDIKTGLHAAKVALVPSASPAAGNTSDELKRRFAIGMNQGEVGANVASLAIGGPLAKSAGRLGDAMAMRRVLPAKYIAQGASPELAEYLAQPYQGMGSHYVPRRMNPPAKFRDSEFNVWKPQGIQRGEFYEGHALRDNKFSGARVPDQFKGESWKFSQSGLKRYGPLATAFHGAPGPLKARVGGLGAATGGVAYSTRRGRD